MVEEQKKIIRRRQLATASLKRMHRALGKKYESYLRINQNVYATWMASNDDIERGTTLVRDVINDSNLRTFNLNYSNPMISNRYFDNRQVIGQHLYDLSNALDITFEGFKTDDTSVVGGKDRLYETFGLARTTTKEKFEEILNKRVKELSREIEGGGSTSHYQCGCLSVLKVVYGEHFCTPYSDSESNSIKREQDPRDHGRYHATDEDLQKRLQEMEKINPSESFGGGKK